MTRKRTAAGIALVIAATVGGCSVSPGAAAVVEDRTISQNRLERAYADLSSIVPNAEASQVLIAMVVAPLFIEAAADAGVGVSEEEARSVLEENAEAAGAEPVEYGEDVVEIIRFTLAAQNLQTLPDGPEVLAEIDAEVAAMDIDINPRYGELDTTTGAITPIAMPWIVPTAPLS